MSNGGSLFQAFMTEFGGSELRWNYGDSCNILFFIIPFFISLKKGNVATVTVIQT